MFFNLAKVIFFGLVIGLSTALYNSGLDQIQLFQQSADMYPVFLVVVFLILFFVKKYTLYFPTSVHQVVASSHVEYTHWSKASYFWNLIGSWLSHFAGASLGREGTTIVLSSSLASLFKMSWEYFKPIIIAATFACVVGQPWIALVIIIEMFATNIEQKIFSLIMAWVGFLTMQSLKINALFFPLQVNLEAGFFDKLGVVLFVGLIVGLMAHFFKRCYIYLVPFFKKNIAISILTILALSWFLIQPEIKSLHSLSLNTFTEVQNGQATLKFAILKIVLTLFFVSLGFIGGDFVPSILIGSSMGVLVANYFHVNYTFGLAVGLMSFFVGLTRLKWTALCMIYLLAGFDVMIWAYLCLSITRQFSGHISLYRKIEI